MGSAASCTALWSTASCFHTSPSANVLSSLLFSSLWSMTVRGCDIRVFKGSSPWSREMWYCEDPGTDCLTLFALCLSPFVFIFPFATHKTLALDSLVPVSVSRTFAFSRGDSLAGSPGKHMWELWVSGSCGGYREGLGSLWDLALCMMNTDLCSPDHASSTLNSAPENMTL